MQQRGGSSAALAWLLLAAAVFGLVTAALYGPVWREGALEFIPTRESPRFLAPILRDDHRFVVWAVARNARTLATAPGRLFDAEQCFPDARSLALGEPVIAMGLYGAPVWLLTRDPVLLYNIVLVGMSFAAALAMYWLIVAWTGAPAAGITAGVLYAFSRFAVLDPVHPYSSDTTPIVLCLLFASRLLRDARWRDALGLAASLSLQASTSFYPLLASAAVAAPFALWLLFVHRRKLPWPQLVFVAVVAAIASWLVLGPYLENRSGGVLRQDVAQSFGALSFHLPGGDAFFGFFGWLLVIAGGLCPARIWQRRVAPDPRTALVLGALLVALLAAGPHAPIDLYGLLGSVLPGLDSVRLPRKILTGVPLVLSVLAGIGLAGLLRVAGEWNERARRGIAAVGILGAVWASLGNFAHYATFDVHPAHDAIAFFAALEEAGNTGPIYETPLPRGPAKYSWSTTSRPLLLSYFHERRTSACYPSHPQPHRAALEAIESRLPERAAIDELRRLGFTTIVLSEPSRTPQQGSYRQRFLEHASRPGSRLRVVHEDDRRVAFEIGSL